MSTSNDVDWLWENAIRGIEMLKFDMAEMALAQSGPHPNEIGKNGFHPDGIEEKEEFHGAGAPRISQMSAPQLNTPEGTPVQRGRESRAYSEERRSRVRDRRITVIDPKVLKFPDRRKGVADRRANANTFGIGTNQQATNNKYTNNGLQYTWIRPGFDREKDLCEECLLKLELPLLKDDGQNLGTLWLVKDLKRDTVTHYTLRRIEHLRRTLISTLTKLQSPPKPKH